MSSSLVIAVDGPAASGKSTLARRIAEHYGLPFLDTGLLYRAVGRRVLAAHGDPINELDAMAAATALVVDDVDAAQLRGEEIGQAASQVAAFGAVRQALLPFQRKFAARPPGAVLAGRDVGTVICPDATVKIFVTASVEERARRRYEELRRLEDAQPPGQLRRGGDAPIYAAVLEELRVRDRRDQERAVAPLRAAPDAWVLDTTDLDADAAFEAVRVGIDRRRR